VATSTPTQPSVAFTPTRTATTGPTATNPPQGTHLTNPFSGANAYVNQYWQGHTSFNVNTSVWLDTNMAVDGSGGYPLSLNGHMDAAVAQGRNFISIVVYNLPGRDCAALASNGLLPATEAGLNTYKTSYIDPIAAAIAAHPNLRVIAIIEPDSLPNLVTNLSDPDCSNVNSQTLYQRGTAYALTKFEALSNVYTYLDIGHAGWLGWPSNFNPAITLISGVIKSANGGNCGGCADGFADNTANTQVETETFLDANTQIGGQPVRQQSFFDWNDFIDESHYATAWKSAMSGAGITSTNMVLDTSRNGWGGCGGGIQALTTCRPTATSTATTLDAYVNGSRIDRRPAKGDWCNQNGAGLGKLPLSAATAPYQAYLWIKPPAESDGSSSLIPIGPDNPDGKGFDQMCDPNYGGNGLNQNKNSNALPNAPVSGRWFQAQWNQLVANKFP
jgi:cellulose 1,4-beta-cellobiosidase